MTQLSEYLTAFCRVSRAFGTTLGKQEILDLIVESAIDTMDGKASCLFLADEEKDVFVPVAGKGLSENYLHARPMQARKVVDEVLWEGGYLSVYDAATDPRLENHEEKKAEGISSILVVPVMAKNKGIGVLSLYTGTPRDFSEDEISFLSALAEQGGMAIEQARLFERLNHNSRVFAEFAAALNSSLDIKKIFHVLSADLGEALGMKGVAIRLLNKDKGTLEMVTSHGLSDGYLNKGPIRPEKCVAKALQGETVVVSDVRTDDRLQYRDAALKEGIMSTLYVPIKAGEEVIGIMRLYSAVQREFPEDMVQLVTALAHQGGLAIQNASMYLLLQEDKKNLEDDIWSHKSWF